MTKCNIKSDVKSNIKNIILKLKLASNSKTDKELADKLNTDAGSFGNWKNQRQEIPIDYLIDFCENYNVSLDWILRKDGIIDIEPINEGLKIPFHKDIHAQKDLSSKVKEYIYLPSEHFLKNNKNHDIVAARSLTTEFPKLAPINSIMLFDKNNIEVTPSPELFLICAHKTFFIRLVSITPSHKCLLRAENENIKDFIEDFEDIKIVAKLMGVVKWMQ